jgi:hypothetical protein
VVFVVETVESSIKSDWGVGGFGEGIMLRPKAVEVVWEESVSFPDWEGSVSLVVSYDDCGVDGIQALISDRTTICIPPKS